MAVAPECRRTLSVLGYLYLRMGRHESARRTFAAIAALLPDDAPKAEVSLVYRNLAAVAMAEGDGAAALDHLHKALDGMVLTSADAALHLLRAQALWQQGRHDEAQGAVETYRHLTGDRS